MRANSARIQAGSSYANRAALAPLHVGVQAYYFRFATRADLAKLDSGDEFHV